jgi:sugar phosphate isomerase/epimerase
MKDIVLAVKVNWRFFPDRFNWLVSNGFPAEYTADPGNLSQIPDHIKIFIQNGLPVRHHGFFPGYEFGSQDEKTAEEAMTLHFKMLDAIKGVGEPFVTFHVGLDEQTEIDPNQVKGNLKRLVQYAGNLGITICLENLKEGPTSDPYTLLEWVEYADAMITLDVGHAVSSGPVAKREITVLQIIGLFEDRLKEVHLYEKETDRHHAPENMLILGPIVDRLLTTECSWWTIELDKYDDILQTKQMVVDYCHKLRLHKTI